MGEEGEENVRFFDAHEESFPSTSIPNPHLSEELEIIEPTFRYEIWAQSPRSVEERRDRFLEWMEKMGLDCSEHNCTILQQDEEDDNRVMEYSGAELRRSLDEFRSSNHSSNSHWSSDSLDWSDEFASTHRENGCSLHYMDEKLVDKEEKKKTTSSSSMSSLSFKQAIDDSDDITVTPSRTTKKGWLKRFRSFSCVLDTKEDDDPDSERLQKVRVRHCGKKYKELSGLFTGQDFQAHNGSILKMKFSPDGQFLATAGEDRIVRVWRIVEEERSNEVDIPQMDPSCIYFTMNHFSELKQFFYENEKLVKLTKNSNSACIVFPPKVFQILETPVHEYCGHGDEILDLSWSDKNFLLTSSSDKTVRLWQVGCNHSIGVFKHSNYVSSVQFNPVDDKFFVSGSIDGKVRIWEVDSCQVVDWIDIRDIVTAVCYRPDGEEVIVGSMSGNCRFYSISDNHLQLDAEICLCSKKKSPCKRITGFEFCPQDSSKVMVTCADSQIRILQGGNVIRRYRGRGSSNLSSSSFTFDGRHIISASHDSNVYIWNCIDDDVVVSRESKLTKSCERFLSNASVAVPWSGMWFNGSYPCSPFGFSLRQGLFLERGSATWPEEQLPFWSPQAASQAMSKTHYKLLKSSCRSTSHAWGLVIVTAGWDGRIRSFLNYGLPVPT